MTEPTIPWESRGLTLVHDDERQAGPESYSYYQDTAPHLGYRDLRFQVGPCPSLRRVRSRLRASISYACADDGDVLVDGFGDTAREAQDDCDAEAAKLAERLAPPVPK